MAYDFSLLHRFAIEGTYLVLDINSGIIHVLSKEAWDFLNTWERCGGDLDRTAAALKKTLGQEDLVAISSSFIALCEEGSLFSKELSLENYQPREEHIVKALCLHVAHDCNMRCQYCFAGTGPFGAERSLMDAETGKKAFDFLFEASGPRRHLEVDYFGGEPLLNFPVVKELIKYGQEKAIKAGKILKQTLTTNALLLNTEIIDFLNKEKVYLILSIDGRPQVHERMRPLAGGQGSFPQVDRQIREFVNRQKDETYYVRGTYTHFNVDFSEDILFLVDRGYNRVSLEPVVADPEQDYALRAEDLPVLKAQYKKLAQKWLEYYKQGRPFQFFHFNLDLNKGPCLLKRLSGCGAGNEYLAVSPSGELYPCHQFMENKDFLLGNVFDGVQNQNLRKTFRQTHVLNKEKCRECWARFYCGGGCHANAYNFNKDLSQPYELGCELQKTRLEYALYVQVKAWEEKTNSLNKGEEMLVERDR
ncbi:MAG: thioether cross-link-forming SCIFF peptide maturase [Clostridia bacterium]|nr:thioether cross-link-forming SCIFF peptide maturase [Clostridia bacterium]MDD4665231.1 thioether cross-link-forming SCIFF peptide maturase [Clostridia bacterium]